jgi:hypothetical protein
MINAVKGIKSSQMKKQRFSAKEKPQNISLNDLLPRQIKKDEIVEQSQFEKQLNQVLNKNVVGNFTPRIYLYDLGYDNEKYYGSEDAPIDKPSNVEQSKTYFEMESEITQKIINILKDAKKQPKVKIIKQIIKPEEEDNELLLDIFDDVGTDYQVTEKLGGARKKIKLFNEDEVTNNVDEAISHMNRDGLNITEILLRKHRPKSEQDSDKESVFSIDEKDQDDYEFGYESSSDDEAIKKTSNFNKQFSQLDKVFQSKYGKKLQEN